MKSACLLSIAYNSYTKPKYIYMHERIFKCQLLWDYTTLKNM